MPEPWHGPASTVAIARREGAWLDVLVLGDSTILLDQSDHVTVVTDTRLESVAPELRREIKNALAGRRGYRGPHHDRRRARLVEAERLKRNRHGGYWIAANEPRTADHALAARHPIGPAPPASNGSFL